MRAIDNAFLREWAGREEEAAEQSPRLQSVLMDALARGDMDVMPAMAGQSAGAIRSIEPAGDLVRRIAREAGEILTRLAAGR